MKLIPFAELRRDILVMLVIVVILPFIFFILEKTGTQPDELNGYTAKEIEISHGVLMPTRESIPENYERDRTNHGFGSNEGTSRVGIANTNTGLRSYTYAYTLKSQSENPIDDIKIKMIENISDYITLETKDYNGYVSEWINRLKEAGVLYEKRDFEYAGSFGTILHYENFDSTGLRATSTLKNRWPVWWVAYEDGGKIIVILIDDKYNLYDFQSAADILRTMRRSNGKSLDTQEIGDSAPEFAKY